MNIAPGLSRAITSALTSRLVAALNARWTLKMSHRAAVSAGEGASDSTSPATSSSPISARSAGAAAPSRPSKRRLQSTMERPNAAARRMTSCAMLPAPRMPSVWPSSPFAFEYSFLFQVPARRSATLSATRQSRARISAIVSSATATAFFPGQFET